MRTFLLSCLLLFVSCLHGQTRYATFHAFLEEGERENATQGGYMDELMEMTWRIHGHVLHWDGDTVAIAVDEEIDTLFFQLRNDREWDTLICNIREPLHFTFEYNTCCNYFDVFSPAPKYHRIEGFVGYRVQHPKAGTRYLGNMDDVGAYLSSREPIVLRTLYCRSPMFPNNHNVVISEVTDCRDSADCITTNCMYEPGKTEPMDGVEVQQKRVMFHFRYLPLSEQPLQVIWNDKKGRLQLDSDR